MSDYPTDNPSNPIDWEWISFQHPGVSGTFATLEFPSIVYIDRIFLQYPSASGTVALFEIWYDQLGTNTRFQSNILLNGANVRQVITVRGGSLTVWQEIPLQRRLYFMRFFAGAGSSLQWQVSIKYTLATTTDISPH